MAKSFSLYKERRFGKQGYTAGSILECVPQLRQLLDRVNSNNLLARACRIYLENDYIVTALKALSNFTYYVTMPFLNCVEKSDQNGLMEILPKLYEDLKEEKFDTLKDYIVPWTHVDMESLKPVSLLDHQILSLMCKEAAEGLKMQCAREYWGDERQKRDGVTELYKLQENERKNLPTENLETERYLAKFGYLASISAARRNKNFKAKRIRDDLLFAKNPIQENEIKVTNEVLAQLKEMEVNWTKDQHIKLRDKVKENLNKKNNANQFAIAILEKCKLHNGPFTTIKQVKDNIKDSSSADVRKVLRQEITFQRVMHPADAKERTELYKLNFLSNEELLTNLCILLEKVDELDDAPQNVNFPLNEEILNKLLEVNIQNTEDNISNEKSFISSLVTQQPLAVVWDGNDGQRFWSIGFYVGRSESSDIVVDHLESKSKCNWIRPLHDDIQDVMLSQIIPVEVIGEWQIGRRISTYIVDNEVEIDRVFNEKFSIE